MKFHAVLFDLDGTLIDTVATYERVDEELFAEHGVHLTREDFTAFYRDGASVLDSWILRTGLDAVEGARLHDRLMQRCQSALLREARWCPDTEDMLRRLPERLPLGVVTSSWHEQIKGVTQRITLPPNLPILVAGDETVGRSKPDPYPLLLACEKLGVTASECVYVGDLPLDMAAAKAAGMQAWCVRRPYAPAETARLADRALDSLTELPDLLAV